MSKKIEHEVVHDFRDVIDLDPKDIKVYDVDPIEPQKRLRAWEERIDSTIESLKPSNYLTELYRFMRGCDHLTKSYPLHEDLGHINSIRIEFWSRYQKKFKEEILPLLKKQRNEMVKRDLKRMGFLL